MELVARLLMILGTVMTLPLSTVIILGSCGVVTPIRGRWVIPTLVVGIVILIVALVMFTLLYRAS